MNWREIQVFLTKYVRVVMSLLICDINRLILTSDTIESNLEGSLFSCFYFFLAKQQLQEGDFDRSQ